MVAERLAAIDQGETPQSQAPMEPVAQGRPRPPPEPVPLGPGERALAELLLAHGDRPRADGDIAAAAGLDPAAARTAWRRLETRGIAVRVGRNLHFHRQRLDPLLARVVAICELRSGASIATLRDELATSRRYAQALLEYLDASGQTIRRGDLHVLRSAGRRGLDLDASA